MLAVRGDGEKMDPAVIFKGVRMPKNLRVPKGIVVQLQEKGWMDEVQKALLCNFKRKEGWMKKAANYGSKTSKHVENAPYSSGIPSEVTSPME